MHYGESSCNRVQTGNYIYMFSTAMYELYRNSQVHHMELVKDNPDNNFRATYKIVQTTWEHQ